MKTKKTLLMLAALFMGSSAFAQMELVLGTGYHMGAFQATNSSAKMTTVNANGTMAENVYYSMGGGLPINFGLGLPLSDNVMFNADFCYWIGTPVEFTTMALSVDLGGGNMLNINASGVAQSTQLRFNPGFTFRSDMGLYARTGLVIPVGGSTVVNIETNSSNPLGSAWSKETRESTGNFAIGASTAFGFVTEIADGMSLGFELQALALNIQGATATITEYSDSDGTTLEEEYDNVFDRETVYVDVLDANSNNTDYNNNVDRTKPMEDFAQRQSFGAWGFNIRFAYTIGG